MRTSARGAVLGPVTTADGELALHPPRLLDGVAWSRARLANRQWLERAFPAWGDDWAAEQSEVAWVLRWWHLGREARQGHAKPYVMVLDGALIGEVGVDAIDEFTGGGEASVWMVRDHGSPAVMNAASLLMLHRAFSGPNPIDRMISPVATTSRKGRTPGLSAVGFTIEATLARRVGEQGMVDHDVWVVHNNPANREHIGQLTAGLPSPGSSARRRSPAPADVVVMARAAARAAARELRAALRQRRQARSSDTATAWSTQTDPDTDTDTNATASTVTVRRAAAHRGSGAGARRGPASYEITRGGVLVGEAQLNDDVGTGVVDISLSVASGTERAVLSAALELLLAAVAAGEFSAAHPAVRIPTGASADTVPDAAMLTRLGLHSVANFPGNPAGPRRWQGEQRWEPSPATPPARPE